MKAKRGFLGLVIVLFISISVLLYLSVLASANTGGGEGNYGVMALPNCSVTCGSTINESCQLNQSLRNSTGGSICHGDGLVINSDNITLDCAGYSLSGDDGIGDYGIDNSNGHGNVTIKNCNIYNFSRGVHWYTDANNGTIFNNTIISSPNMGIYLYYSMYNNITGNTLIYNNDAVYLGSNSHDNYIISNNLSNNTGDGINIGGGIGNTVLFNTINHNNFIGISLNNGDNNTIFKNTINDYGSDGIYIYSHSWHNNVTENTVNNGNIGISLATDGFYNIISSNNISSNTNYGIRFDYNCKNNTISGNTITNNSYGIYLEPETPVLRNENNIIYNNYFNNTINAFNSDSNNTWNTTYSCAAGPNIIGGSCIGGNYWSDYNGSDTTGDYIGDTLVPHDSTGNITFGGDYLPLVYHSDALAYCDYIVSSCKQSGWESGKTYCLDQNIATSNADCIRITDNSSVTLDCRGFHINSTTNNNDGIEINGCSNNSISNCVIGGFSNGINIVSSNSNTIDNCSFDLQTSASISLYGDNHVISNCRFYGAVFYVNDGTDNFIIENNNFIDHSGMGIICSCGSSSNRCFNGTIRNNYFYAGTSNSIYFEFYVENTSIYSNVFNQTGATYISAIRFFRYNYYNHVFNNTILDPNGYGITIQSSLYNVIENNTIIGADASSNSAAIKMDDFGFEAPEHNRIVGNKINYSYYGIRMEQGNYNLIANNTFFDGVRGIYMITEPAYNNFTGNNVSDFDYGIYITSSNNRIWDNYFSNTINAYDTGTNYWNTTHICSAGISNVIGKSCIGGNYWPDYAGKETTGDYIGDTLVPYTSSGNIQTGGDYLPLVSDSSPAISLVSPANGTTSSSASVTFTYTPSDDTGIANCSLIMDGAVSQTDYDVANNVQNSFSETLANADYTWSINCTDNGSAMNTKASATYNLTVSVAAGGGGGGGGEPPPECADACISGETRCSGSGFEACGNYDDDSCTEWGGFTACLSYEICTAGECVCAEDWNCTEWGECSALGLQARVCSDLNSCGTSEFKPAEEIACAILPSCDDGIQNQGEEDVDCGGPCAQCELVEEILEEGIEAAPSVEQPAPSILSRKKKAKASEPIEEIGGCFESFFTEEVPEVKPIDPEEILEKIMVPEGYDIIKEPFQLQCAGGYYEMVLSVPEGYGSIRPLRCRGGECSAVEYITEQDFICGGSQVIERKVAREKDYIEAEEIAPIESQEKAITAESPFVSSGSVRVEFTGILPPEMTARMRSPSWAVHQPKNPSLGLTGSPVVLEISPGSGYTLPARITVPFIASEDYDMETTAVYASRKSNSTIVWEIIGGEINFEDETVSAEVDDIGNYLDGGAGMFAAVSSVCVNCKVSSFEKVYHSEGSRNAVVLVHGLDSSPATFNELLGDFVYNNQPWQIWAFGYSSAKPIKSTATELALFLQMHEGEYDTVSIVGHSLGAIIAQIALRESNEERKESPEKFSYLGKVRRAILVASPNDGSPGADVYLYLQKYLASLKDSFSLFNANSDIIARLAKGFDIPKVPGVKYYVIAGTKPMEFNLGPIKLSTESFFEASEKHDGIITTSSAQTIHGEKVDDLCSNYWEIRATHTDIIDHPFARKFIEKILSESIAEDAAQKGLVGYNQYFRLAVQDCSPDDYYVLVGKEIREADICDPCNCGDRVCGACESQLTCPEDCGFIIERDFLGPMIIYVMIIFTFIISAAYTAIRFILQKEAGTGWIKAIITLLVLDSAASGLYGATYNEHILLAYFSIAFVALYLIVLSMHSRPAGLQGVITNIQKGAAETAERKSLLSKFYRPAAGKLGAIELKSKMKNLASIDSRLDRLRRGILYGKKAEIRLSKKKPK